jgi:hypothetical protein
MTTVSDIVQNILNELGQVEPTFGLFTATGGSATTFVNSAWGDYESPPETDVFKTNLLIVVRDTAGAAPQGKYSLISAYDDATYTGTMATLTDAVASGDTLMIAKQDKYPLAQIIFAINRGLESLGDVPANADETLVTISNNEQYSIPVGVKRGLKQVWIEDTDGYWTQVHDRRNELTGAGTVGRLFLPVWTAGQTIRLIYDGVHPKVNAYSDEINEYIHPKVITNAAILKLLEWYNRQDSNQDPESYTLWLEGQYRSMHLPQSLAENPIQRPTKSARFMSMGRRENNRSRYSNQLLEK